MLTILIAQLPKHSYFRAVEKQVNTSNLTGMRNSFFLLLLFAASTAYTNAQHTNFNTQSNWALNKKEILFGFGGTQFLGDLGGRDQIGTDYSLADIDWASTSLGGMVGYRFRFHPRWATSTTLNIGMVRGDDALTNEIVRQSRNLHFRSMFYELQQRIEIIILANEKFGNRYGLGGHSRKMKNRNEQIYLFTGVGVNYYNPKARFQGEWVALRPLGTEGQGSGETFTVYNGDGTQDYVAPDRYLPVTATIPFGVGMRMGIGRMWRLGIEATYIKTFTDYMDDVSGYYADPAYIAAATQGDANAAVYLANPATDNTAWFAPGQQRGDAQNDAFYTVNIVVARNLTYKDYAKSRRMNRWRGRYKF